MNEFPDRAPAEGAKFLLEQEAHLSLQDPEVELVRFAPVAFTIVRAQLRVLTPRDKKLAEFFDRQGFVYPDRMVRALRDRKIKPQTAAALLTMETGNGRSVWGHDPVKDFNCYSKGGAVTEENYTCYKRRRGSGDNAHDMQGCSSTQLTYWSFQNQADRLGGCWHPYYNKLVGFGLIKSYVDQGSSLQQAFTRYNGSPAYGERAMEWRREWTRRLERAGFNVS